MGCSVTKTFSSITRQVDENQAPTAVVTTTAPSPNRTTRIIENCIVVWLAATSTIKTHKNVVETLQQVIGTLRTFDDPNECVAFIENVRDEKVFVVVSPETEEVLQGAYFLPQIEQTYVFDTSSQNMDNATDHVRDTKTFCNIAGLCEELRQDLDVCERDLLNIILVSTHAGHTIPSSVLGKQTAAFLCVQLVKNIALRIKFENEHKGVFLDFCRKYYAQLGMSVQALDEFENEYRPKNVLWWVTGSSFVSRILRRVLRTHEIDVIYKMGFLIRHTHTQLTLLHETVFSLAKDRLIVYRGKSMSNDELAMLLLHNCGDLLSFSNFFTASIHKSQAVDLIRRRIGTRPKVTAVLFEIHLDLMIRSTTNVYALINSSNSNISSEEGEICFTMGTVFRIQSVEQATDNLINLWTVKLTVIDDNDQQLFRLLAPLRTTDVDSNPLSYLGKLLIQMGACDRAEQFYLDLISDPSVFGQPRRFARLHNGLGVIFTYKNEHTKALEHYLISLRSSLSYMPPDHPDLAPIYKLIGNSYFNNSNYSRALENYERSARLVKDNAQQIDPHLIIDLNDCIAETKQQLEQTILRGV